MDLISIKKEFDECIKISNNKNITPLMNEGSMKMTPQEFLELTEKRNLIHTDNLESKVEYIQKVSINSFRLCSKNYVGLFLCFQLIKAEEDLQILADSLLVQV